MNRRSFFSALAAPLAIALGFNAFDALADPRPRLRRRFRVRRRIRRHAFTRVRFGRPFWVVPVGLAVGWELRHGNRVVVVKETKVIHKDGATSEVALIQDSGGATEEVEITREDTADNDRNLEGSVLDDDDTTTPAVESE